MKDKNIKKVFDQIQADEAMKARMLENIYKQSSKELKNDSSNKKVVQFKYKKSMAALAASVALVCGIFINSNMNINRDISSSPIQMEPEQGEAQSPGTIRDNEEFMNFDLEHLKNNAFKMEIRNHENTSLLSEVEDKQFIRDTLNFLDHASEKDIRENNYKILGEIEESEAKGNSITLRFIDEAKVAKAITVNLDLGLVCMNDNYYEVPKGFIDNINEKIKGQ